MPTGQLRRGTPIRENAVAKKRPAEKLTGTSAAALVVAYFFDIRDPEVLTALGVVIGLLPGVVTWLVELFVAAMEPPLVTLGPQHYDFDALRELSRLKTEGIITEEDFLLKKAELLDLTE